MGRLVVRSMTALLLVLGAVALTLIPRLREDVCRLEELVDSQSRQAPMFFSREGVSAVAESVLSAAREVDANARLEGLGGYGHGAVTEVRFRLRMTGRYQRIATLLEALESGGEISRLSSLRLHRRSDGRGELDVVVSILAAEEGPS